MSVVTPGNSPPLGSQLPEPLPPTTGPSSTPPSTRPEDDYPPEHHDEHRLLENIEATENVQRLGRLLAIDSVNRNLNTEDAAFRAEIERDMADDTITDGGKVDLGKDEADDQMKIYAANTGPLIIHRPDPPAQKPTQTQPIPPPSKPGIPPWLAATAVLGSLATSGVAGSLLGYLASRPNGDTDTVSELMPGFGIPGDGQQE